MVQKVSEEFKLAFTKRFHEACADNPRIPPLNRGLYRYIADRMTERGVPTTSQAVQKWYQGQAIPVRDRLALLADVIGSDPDYLLIGSTASEVKAPVPRVMGKNGALNLMIGTLELKGVHCAVSEDDDPGDLYVMRDGRMTRLIVRGIAEPEGSSTLAIPKDHYRSRMIIVWLDESARATFYHLPPDLIEQHGAGPRELLALDVTFSDGNLSVGGGVLAPLGSPLNILV